MNGSSIQAPACFLGHIKQLLAGIEIQLLRAHLPYPVTRDQQSHARKLITRSSEGNVRSRACGARAEKVG